MAELSDNAAVAAVRDPEMFVTDLVPVGIVPTRKGGHGYECRFVGSVRIYGFTAEAVKLAKGNPLVGTLKVRDGRWEVSLGGASNVQPLDAAAITSVEIAAPKEGATPALKRGGKN